MYEIMVEGQFAAAHRLLNYDGICENIHGHNWKVQVYLTGDDLDQAGILVDFKHINQALTEVLSLLDHKDINGLEEFKNISPSSELIAKFIYYKLKEDFSMLQKVSVWETDKARASFYELK